MALTSAFSVTIRGRDAELEAFGELLGRVRSGSGAVLLIEGAAGMGKTRLLAEGEKMAHRLGFPVGIGAAEPSESVAELAPLLRALFDGPEPLRVCITTGGISGSVVCLGFLIMGAEGLICIGVALPLAVPMALAEVHSARADGNRALDSGDHDGAMRQASAIRAMMDILGCDPLNARWESRDETSAALAAVDELVHWALESRTEARAQRDWAQADRIRDRLKEAGIEVTDTADGPQWSLLDGSTRDGR